VLVKVAPEATPAVVRDRLPVAMPNTRVLTQDEYLGEMLTCVLKEMQTVLTFATSTLMSLLVGRITVALSMFSAVVDTLRQVETIKAIGATNGDLAKLLLVQAVTSGVLAFQALRGIGLEVREGEFRMLVGPSGSGKTTLLSILGCVLTPTTGRAWPFDEPLHGRPEAELPELLTRRRPPLVGFTHLLDTCGVQIIRGALAEPVTVPLSTDVRRAGREAKSRVDGLDEKRPLESLGAHWVGGNGVVEIARRFGWKNIRSDGPVEKNDTKVLETVIELDSNALLIPGQRVTCFVAAAPDAT
jgi:energy-coupling factor transporter ATP-binding protein EcfA2